MLDFLRSAGCWLLKLSLLSIVSTQQTWAFITTYTLAQASPRHAAMLAWRMPTSFVNTSVGHRDRLAEMGWKLARHRCSGVASVKARAKVVDTYLCVVQNTMRRRRPCPYVDRCVESECELHLSGSPMLCLGREGRSRHTSSLGTPHW